MCADDANAVPGEDLLVIPEVYGPGLADIGPGMAKVVFNRNTYNTFKGYPLVPKRGAVTAYDHPEVVGAVCVSDDNVEYLRYAFPRLHVERIVNPVDPALFHPERKQPLVTFMPRKNADDAGQVLHLLAARGALRDVEVVPLHGMTQEQVAAVQRRALMFLCFGHPEGWGRPPAEAMACGAVVVGYHGMGGREFFDASHAFPVVPGDVLGFARAAEQVLELWREAGDIGLKLDGLHPITRQTGDKESPDGTTNQRHQGEDECPFASTATSRRSTPTVSSSAPAIALRSRWSA
jgi:hypothetical protein